MTRWSTMATALAGGVLATACALAAAAVPAGAWPVRPTTSTTVPAGGWRVRSTTSTALLQSPELLATVDICSTPRHPHTIGIRGSMPSDGHPHDTMYMRFRVESFNSTTKQWVELGGADSGFVSIGVATTARQAGRTFEFKSTATTYTLRGLVEFQWRRAGRVVHLASIPTTAQHTSLAGAEPKGFSAATCELK